nr:ribosome biogenesis GTP-binding protein YihA/YsxC [Candidatus Gracilibacteria bacterium]
MKITEVKFIKSISIKSEEVLFEQSKPEIVFVGRSNVGKSSLMNAIFGTKDLVKTSSVPGKTRTANLFLLNKKYYFTDLPGYGFAKLGQDLKKDLDSLISWYIEERKNSIKCVVILLDTKIGPQETDIDMYNYLHELGLPMVFVLTKTDRLGNNDIKKSVLFTEGKFFGQKIFPVSSAKNIGIRELFNFLSEKLTAK